ncbi:AAA family ATPase [Streptomyces endophytica]|uniref:AAA family ATPase n=1 Tax=Streptomyces endophytica TaxID=2991496 RepID=UPI003C6EB993
MASTGRALPDAGPPATLPWSGDPLLDAKLTVPAAPRAHVPRHRLLDGLSAGAAGPLTLVTGPAGTGKTTLAAAWARSGGPPGPVAWLTLDAYDRTPGVFWSYVVEALRRALPRLPDGIGMPSSPGEAGTSLLTRLAAATERLPAPVVLVLDGFEKVAGRRVPAGLEFLLDHAGPLWRLVITSRVDPLLPLHRYRAEDRLTEVRGADLAFTPHETAVLLRRHGLRPPDDVAQALTRRTEGWAAGLRLCVLAMCRTGDPAAFVRSFVRSEQAVSGYLLAEVLDAQSAATTELLLRTSVLDRIHPDLANALGGGGDAEAILARLTHDNAFVEPVPGTTWCRVHPLFAEVLRTQLRIRHPGLAPRLHARAARWLAGADRVTEALEHAAEAGDWPYGASLAVHQLLVGTLLATSEAERVEGAFARMPSSVPGDEPALVAAACRLAQQDRAGCRTHLAGAERERAQRQLPGQGTQPDPEVALTHVLLRLLCGPEGSRRPEHGRRGDGDDRRLRAAEEAARAASDLLRRLPLGLVRAHPEIEALRLHGLARAFLGAGRLGEARRLAAEAVDACATEATLPLRHRALGLLALAESAEGALTSAEDHALRALAPPTIKSSPRNGARGPVVSLWPWSRSNGTNTTAGRSPTAASNRPWPAPTCPTTRSWPPRQPSCVPAWSCRAGAGRRPSTRSPPREPPTSRGPPSGSPSPARSWSWPAGTTGPPSPPCTTSPPTDRRPSSLWPAPTSSPGARTGSVSCWTVPAARRT